MTNQQRMKTAWAKCRCDAGIRQHDGQITITPHAMDCAGLRAACRLSRREARCTECGTRLLFRRRGNYSLHHCPNGHEHGMVMHRSDKAAAKAVKLRRTI